MSFLVKSGTITAKTGSVGNQAYTGIGFQPKALILFATAQTATGYLATQTFAFGFSASATQRLCMAEGCDSGIAGGNSQKLNKDLAISIVTNGNGVIGAEADFVSFDADGFTLNWTTIGSAYVISYLALGGTEMTNVYAGRYVTTAVTSTQAITGVGFKPDCVLFGINGSTSWPLSTGSHGQIGIGAACSASQQGALTVRDNNSASPATLDSTYQRTNKCAVNLSSTADTVLNEYDLATMDADGFTLNTPTVAVGTQLIFIAFKGGKYYVGNDTQKSGTGNKAKTGVGFQPKGLLLFGASGIASSSVVHNGITMGATDGATDTTRFAGGVNASNPGVEASRYSNTRVLSHSTPPSTTNAEAQSNGFASDGFTLNWLVADATLREFIIVAFGETPFPTQGILDDFNRADGYVGSNWCAQAGIGGSLANIATNRAVFNASPSKMYWLPRTFGPDSEAYISIPVHGSAPGFVSVAARMQNPFLAAWSGYEVVYSTVGGGEIDVYKIVAGTRTNLFPFTGISAWSSGDRLGIEVLGVGATVTINVRQYTAGAWNLYAQAFDTDADRIILPGYIGFGIDGSSAGTWALDDFGGGTSIDFSTPVASGLEIIQAPPVRKHPKVIFTARRGGG